ncbi:MAG: molybdopterin converting factor subunit 1 [Alphaproteobacteria bacterium RIFOXYD12_FULL_60_8]|nr:MAG: molybdopterin converting factor subunit 1 [Alphaproteobacteria bacterium RIFOXYD12_FULL_60_8]
MRVLYFAWVKERVGHAAEDVAWTHKEASVLDLIAHLRSLSPRHAEAFADPSLIRVAVNQEHVRFEAKVGDGDEVAFFPPVTGG